ncbi:MAG: response regulator transcription factor [Gammaproteobacteria bacterium]|nr:response regulator transcription factor [Gammaproteobacteria bacterium]
MRSQRLLVVDDDQSFLSVLKRALVRRGFVVIPARSGQEALAAASRYRPGQALVDLKLGAESGLLLIRPLRQLVDDMKIVVLTGYGSIPTAVQAVKAGAHNYLAKPIDVDTVVAAFAEMPEEPPAGARMSLRRLEWEHIQRVLEEHGGNISATARSLNMHRRTLQRKLQKRPEKG